jgi:hypothetical protein
MTIMRTSVATVSHRRYVIGAVTAVGLLGVMPGLGAAAPSAQHHATCPAAESLVPNTTWHTRSLAKGVTVSAGTADDQAGQVNMHILRVDLTRPRVRVTPLVHSLAQRLPLSTLAAKHSRLVAATNTGYFDFQFGAPTDPLIVKAAPQVMSSSHEAVVGLGQTGRLQSGEVWLAATVSANHSSQPVVGENEVYPPNGITVYNHRWGSARVPGGWSTVGRNVVNGAVVAGTVARGATVPTGGYLLQARGSSATTWLKGLPAGTKVALSSAVKTNAPSAFTQAYGVGVQLVAQPGVAKTGFSCDSSNTKTPARTAIGWTNGGRTMIMAVVADHRHTSLHGLDQDQMSKLMVQLGVSQAWSFDGSGSTELLAKFRKSTSLKLQNYPADGAERPMPVGLGISVKPVKRRHH